MDRIDFDRLPLLDMKGERTILTEHFEKYILLIFLRHLA
jgi:hypothetical protein